MIIFILLSQVGMSLSYIIQLSFYCRIITTPNAVCSTFTRVEIFSSVWETVAPEQEVFVLEAHEISVLQVLKATVLTGYTAELLRLSSTFCDYGENPSFT